MKTTDKMLEATKELWKSYKMCIRDRVREYMKKEILGKCMLLMSALIWGSSFIVMKNAVDFISPFTLLCIRFVLSLSLIHIFNN